jgi:hypothetical protein
VKTVTVTVTIALAVLVLLAATAAACAEHRRPSCLRQGSICVQNPMEAS